MQSIAHQGHTKSPKLRAHCSALFLTIITPRGKSKVEEDGLVYSNTFLITTSWETKEVGEVRLSPLNATVWYGKVAGNSFAL